MYHQRKFIGNAGVARDREKIFSLWWAPSDSSCRSLNDEIVSEVRPLDCEQAFILDLNNDKFLGQEYLCTMKKIVLDYRR